MAVEDENGVGWFTDAKGRLLSTQSSEGRGVLTGQALDVIVGQSPQRPGDDITEAELLRLKHALNKKFGL